MAFKSVEMKNPNPRLGQAVQERGAEKRPNVFIRLWWLHLREVILWHLAPFLAMTILIAFRVRAEVMPSVWA